MNRHYRTRLAGVCAVLNDESARYVLIGAAAMQLWGTTRATRDIDVLIEPTPENGRRVLTALARVGFGFAREWSAEDLVKRPVTVIGDAPRVDVFTVAWSVHYPEAAARAVTFDLEASPSRLRRSTT